MSLDLSKRYWLFTHSYHEGRGGMEDCRGSFETIEGAHDAIRANLIKDSLDDRWFLAGNGPYQVVDVQERHIVEEGQVDFDTAAFRFGNLPSSIIIKPD